MKITKSKDCENSPKNKFVQDISIALLKADLNKLTPWVSDDVEWTICDETPVIGRDRFIEAVRNRNRDKFVAIDVARVMSHGKAGAAHGTLSLGKGRQSNFCFVFEFSTAAAKSITRIHSFGALI